jgi:hypothetical protein
MIAKPTNDASSSSAASIASSSSVASRAVLYHLFIICANPKPAARNLAMKLARPRASKR